MLHPQVVRLGQYLHDFFKHHAIGMLLAIATGHRWPTANLVAAWWAEVALARN